MLSYKQGSIKYHFLCLWHNSTWDWTLFSRAIGEHANHLTNARLHCYIRFIIIIIIIYFLCDWFLWLFLTIGPNKPSLFSGPLDVIQCPNRADECKFRPTRICPSVGVHRRMLLTSLFIIHQQFPWCLVRLTRKVSVRAVAVLEYCLQ